MQYIVHDETGIIQRWGSAGQEPAFWEHLVETDSLRNPDAVFWDGAAWQTLPPPPGLWAVWDGAAWIDPRTPAEMATELSHRRSGALMDKAALVLALDQLGILSPAEVDEVTRGDIPARIAALMDGLPADARRAAITKWRLDAVISRTHPVIVSAAYGLGITDEALDQIFGVSP